METRALSTQLTAVVSLSMATADTVAAAALWS